MPVGDSACRHLLLLSLTMTACVCISLDIFNIESSISDISRSDKVLLVIPGIGFHTNRTETVLWNLDILRRSNVSYQCIAFAYKIPPLKKTDLRIRSSCHLHYYFNGNYASYMKAIVPSVLNSAGFTHVMVLLDDVELGRHFRYVYIPDRNMSYIYLRQFRYSTGCNETQFACCSNTGCNRCRCPFHYSV